MPTFFELVDAPTSSEVQKPKGLFETLLGGRAEALFADAEEHPDKYSDETTALMRELVLGQKKLESLPLSDQYLLDQATIDFASAPSKPVQAAQPPQTLKKEASVEAIEEEEEEEDEQPFKEGPEASLVPFWWR